MKSSVYERLLEAFSEFEIIDAHEHIPVEANRLAKKMDALALFNWAYAHTDLVSSGLAAEAFQRIQDPELPLEYRWGLFAPYFEHIRYGSYARPAFIAAKDLYGFDTIDESTYLPLSEAIREATTPGIYHRILREKCKIRTVLTQQGHTDMDLDLLVPVMPFSAELAAKAADPTATANTLDDYLALAEKGLEKWKSQGAVGLKMVCHANAEPSRAEAVSLFERQRRTGEKSPEGIDPLNDYLMDQMLRMCARLGMVVAVHAGMWRDFRTLEPTQMIPVFQRHPETKFDLYHMGMPHVRETGVIGKNFANVWLNLCWSHVISPRMVRSALDEWMDLVPVNKIIAFGGDYGADVENVYGHLVMARENIAHVLAGRVEQGLMSEEQAVAVAHKWFYENPKALYSLRV